MDDGLIAGFSDPEVGFFDAPPRLSDLLHLLVENLLGFSLYRLEGFLIGLVAQAGFVYLVDGVWVAACHAEDVQLRVRGVGEVGGGASCQLCLARPVRGQQYLGREDTHRKSSLLGMVLAFQGVRRIATRRRS